ncbi:RagB/SusD family nutrient uptake outer membrane protein [Sphingobacterium haloxyli]|uniref:RagB/SusD family nutrient uptake outer membrane protein n=1 Tax=Sphingobacterium haloxyli TaxID=2100533 RepID=A0A2S9J133_9SPHI|nr:RagB/SusD family nutrient uptake outer membrane protein [Sphingobacterium haloxyli]PRD46478.1 RagB/SusD family nutrient uptake outer membrane protein [Sphingobacterium haloxyli]
MNKILSILSITALSAILSSCEKLLDKQPLSQIPESGYFRTEQDLEFFTNPLYNMLNMDDRQQSDHLVQMTLSEVIIGGNRRTVPNSGGGWDWGDLRRINTFLARVDQAEDEAAIRKYSGVARFFRAMFYFNKIKRFGDVPWYDAELGSSDEALYKPRDPRELVMTKMIEDIDYAIDNLPDEVSVFRINKWTALALKSRFCLYEGTFRKYHGGEEVDKYLELAAAAAKEVIDAGRYRLYTTGGEEKSYFTLFSQDDADPGEFILAYDYSASPRVNHNGSSFTMSAAQGRPSYTKKFVNTYLMTDGSRFTDQSGWETMTFIDEVKDRDPRLSQSIRNPKFTLSDNRPFPNKFSTSVNGYHPIKFLQDETLGYDVRVGYSSNDLPIFRYAEVLLNYAEAKAELGTLTQADIDISIKLLRDRVGMPNLDVATANANPDPYLLSAEAGYTNVSAANIGVILEVRRERGVELVQEGFRLDDLVRWKAGYCIDQPLLGIYFPGPGEYDLTGDGQTNLVLYTNGNKPADEVGVEMFEIGIPVNNGGMILSEGTKGNAFYHSNIALAGFNEQRDYFYPIPINERSLNNNLDQNPGWVDGLNF